MDMMQATPSFNFTPINFVNMGWEGHMPFAYDLVSALQPATLVELGAFRGESYFAFCQSVLENNLATRSYAVDTWQGDPHAGYYADTVFDKFKSINEQAFARFSTMLRMTFDEALSQFPDSSIDLLHIDGFHTYDAVKHDFSTWLPKLKPAAVVLFHDVSVVRDDFGVWKFWNEIKVRYPTFEFSHSNGLGVAIIGSADELRPSPLLSQLRDSAGHEQLRTYYERFSELFVAENAFKVARDSWKDFLQDLRGFVLSESKFGWCKSKRILRKIRNL